MKKGYKVLIVTLAVILAASAIAITAAALAYKPDAKPEEKVYPPAVSLESIYLPYGNGTLREEGLGLFWIKKEGNEYYRYKSDTPQGLSAFDPEKPIFIFSHGMHATDENDSDFSLMLPFLQAGYNLGLFYYTQFGTEPFPWNIEEKIWGTNGDFGMRYYVSPAKFEEEDVPDVSVAEIFAAYYLDFMKSVDYKGSEIRFSGHSMGGQVTAAVTSYLVTKEAEGMIPADYLPDRITLFDPYFSGIANQVKVDWMDRKISEPVCDESGAVIREDTSNIEFAAETLKIAAERGIAIEIIPTVTGITIGASTLGTFREGGLAALYASAEVLQFRCDWSTDAIGDFNTAHESGMRWYAAALNKDNVREDNGLGQYTLSPKVPTSYVMAREGVQYEMQNPNMTAAQEDDVIRPVNVYNPVVAGFAFYDLNSDGAYNERIKARAAGIKVELYRTVGGIDTRIGSAITDKSGFYKIEVDGSYASGFDTLYVKAYPSGNNIITSRADKIEMMNNDINPDSGASDTFVFGTYLKSVKIINVGIK
jgi:hypothetical protein